MRRAATAVAGCQPDDNGASRGVSQVVPFPRARGLRRVAVLVARRCVGLVRAAQRRAPSRRRSPFSDLLRDVDRGAVAEVVVNGDALDVQAGRRPARSGPLRRRTTSRRTRRSCPTSRGRASGSTCATAAEQTAYSYGALLLGLAFVGVARPDALPRHVRPHSGAREQDARGRSAKRRRSPSTTSPASTRRRRK